MNCRRIDRGEKSSESSSVEGFEDPPTAPKIDKGKGKAESEPKEPEKEGSVLVIRRMKMRMPLRWQGLHPLIGKSFFLAA